MSHAYDGVYFTDRSISTEEPSVVGSSGTLLLHNCLWMYKPHTSCACRFVIVICLFRAVVSASLWT